MPSLYAIAHSPTPLLNTPNFRSSFGGQSGGTIPLDAVNLLRSVETVAFKGAKFNILEEMSEHIVRVSTLDYPEGNIYADRRFFNVVDQEPEERRRVMPSIPAILKTLDSLLGTRYIWGGTWPTGVPDLLKFYPPLIDLTQASSLIADTWQLKGIDCSGLLYYATDGSTPRNSAQLIHYGNPVPIEGKTPQEIVDQLNTLDLIVWKGHVVIVRNENESIESLLGYGVIKQSLIKRIEEIMFKKRRIPVNKYSDDPDPGNEFVIRRWLSKNS